MINFSDILDRNCPLWTIEMLFETIKISKFWGVAFPHNPLMAHRTPSVLARFISDWKMSQLYLLKRLDSLCEYKI